MLPKSANEDCFDKKAVQTAETLEVEDDCNTSVCGRCSSADGCNTSSSGECSHAEGCGSKALGDCSHAEGSNTRALENNSHAEGCSTRAIGNCSHAEGSNTIAYSDSSHTEGLNTKTRGNYAHGEGNGNEANGESSHAQGVGTKAEGYASSSEGGYTTVRGSYAHAEGYSTTVNGYYSHAEGVYTTATGNYSHAEGYSCLTEGYGSHAEGYYTSARAPFSHSEGYYTDTKLNTGSHIMGIYGEADTPYSWFLGGGTSNLKALAAKILYTGDGYIRNAWHAGGSGYAEVYPGLGGQTIEPGYFVTLEGEFIRKAKDSDKFVLGVTSVNPAFVASSSELNLGSNFLTNAWNQTLYEDNLVPEKTDTEGNVTEPAHVIKQPMQKLQSSVIAQAAASCQDSISSLVTLLGQVLVLDDGTCEPNGYCWPNKDGIATTSSFGYRVMKRISDNQVLIFFRG
ncbi:peptidase G2 autoproteolytic cleavage domain-containing protein [Aminipila terrae]|uniref:Peptidase G2 IMC autoproteolytic cleavage domain-containing protein n=1 Tax=Aminipila terrae TaxID=2697030 RepID=A0A6P1MGF8_9FIRM|nr:peptidase G2 autoproteolytic cleavage domain-containing protein [Aminipila terrae]QHI71664.1 hypothetical protein Ami3637_04050 [Aminipila terrae]